jgi:acetylornithine deacetylase/succinyl-diaminopimelate desuccinylase-like protein
VVRNVSKLRLIVVRFLQSQAAERNIRGLRRPFFRTRYLWPSAVVMNLMVFGGSMTSAQIRIDRSKAGAEGIEWLRQYLMINTTNPPGNEARGTEFFAQILYAEGISYYLMESSPGRGIIYAKLPGDGSEKGLVLLNHIDVVPRTSETWTVDPFAAITKNGFLYGRGAADMKDLGMLEFATFVQIHRSKVHLKRDLIFLATADEELGGFVGAGWFAEHHADLLKNAGFLLNEGGGGLLLADGRIIFKFGVAEKVPDWVRLTAFGSPGHGSVPNPDSAVNHILAALQHIQAYKSPVILTPVVERYFKALAASEPGPMKERFENIRESVNDPVFLKELFEHHMTDYAQLTNTANINVIHDSTGKVNVVASKAEAEIDFRLVPGSDGDEWIEQIRKIIADPSTNSFKITNWRTTDSPVDTPLTQTFQEVLTENYPDVAFVPGVSTAFNDSHWFRQLGIAAYGLTTVVTPSTEEMGLGVHGTATTNAFRLRPGKKPSPCTTRWSGDSVQRPLRAVLID